MVYSLSSPIKLTRKELTNIFLDYQRKFDNSLGSVNAELLELKSNFTKMKSDHVISRNVKVKLVERLVVTEQECLVNEQYSDFPGISVIPESVSDNTRRILREIDVEVDTENIAPYHRLKGNGNKENVILKLCKRKDRQSKMKQKPPEKY